MSFNDKVKERVRQRFNADGHTGGSYSPPSEKNPWPRLAVENLESALHDRGLRGRLASIVDVIAADGRCEALERRINEKILDQVEIGRPIISTRSLPGGFTVWGLAGKGDWEKKLAEYFFELIVDDVIALVVETMRASS